VPPHSPGPSIASTEGATARSAVSRIRQTDGPGAGAGVVAVRAGGVSVLENGRGRGSGTVCAAATSARATSAMMAQLRFT
jgi:hypothetical protein